MPEVLVLAYLLLDCARQLAGAEMTQDSARLALAARIHVHLRRKTGRVTDTEWLAINNDYAAEIIRVCRAEQDEELQKLAQKLEEAFAARHVKGGKAVSGSAVEVSAPEQEATWIQTMKDAVAVKERDRKVEQRYVGRLR